MGGAATAPGGCIVGGAATAPDDAAEGFGVGGVVSGFGVGTDAGAGLALASGGAACATRGKSNE
jgi:hypothetical protein